MDAGCETCQLLIPLTRAPRASTCLPAESPMELVGTVLRMRPFPTLPPHCGPDLGPMARRSVSTLCPMPRHLCGQHNLSRCLTCVYFGLPSLPARIFARSSIRFEVHVNIVDTTFASAGVLGPKTGRTCFLAPSAPAPASDLAGSTGVVGMRREVCWSRGGPGDKAGIPEPPKTSQRLGVRAEYPGARAE